MPVESARSQLNIVLPRGRANTTPSSQEYLHATYTQRLTLVKLTHNVRWYDEKMTMSEAGMHIRSIGGSR